MTTDLLVTYRYDDGNEEYIAYSIKPRREAVEKTPENEAAQEKQRRTLEKLYIERCYWHLKGIKYNLWFKDDMNRTFVENIQLIVRFYDIKEVYSKETAILFLLANKITKTDLETEPIAGKLSVLTEEYFGESRKWETLLTADQKKLIEKDLQ